MRLLCFGPRDLDRRHLPAMVLVMGQVLQASSPYEPGFCLLHGAAPGADTLAGEALAIISQRKPWLWMPEHPVAAEWEKFRASADPKGRRAGPARNRRLIELRPTFWLAFFEGPAIVTPGTLHMRKLVHEAGIPGREWPLPVLER